MTPRALTYQALDYLGDSFSTITQAGPRKLARIASDMTSALQEISRVSEVMMRVQRGAITRASETVSVTVVQNSPDVTFTGTFTNRSTIRFDGDTAWNEVRLEGSQKKLLYPYKGASGTVNATLYHDVIPVDADASQVLGAPLLVGYGYLHAAANRRDLLDGPRTSMDYGRRVRCSTASNRLTGTPTRFWVEDYQDVSYAQGSIIRLYPIPTEAQQVSYDVRLAARVITVADLGIDATDSNFVLPLQEQYHESLLRPIFLEKWFQSTWPRNEEAKKEIKAQAAQARASLDNFKPQTLRNRNLVAPL